MAGQQAPDLASILKTLAGLSEQNDSSSQPLSDRAPPPTALQSQARVLATRQAVSTVPESEGVAKERVDPATIIDWPSGLKHVMKMVGVQDHILKDIKRMIEVQHDHEIQWYSGRKALIEKQLARVEGQKKLDDVLKAVGAMSQSNTKPGTQVAAEELKTYDLKVHKAQTQMYSEMNMRFKNLGIPFFGTKPELGRKLSSSTIATDATNDKRKIDEAELRKLQKRMLEMLEDLCQE